MRIMDRRSRSTDFVEDGVNSARVCSPTKPKRFNLSICSTPNLLLSSQAKIAKHATSMLQSQ
jgi:hypothetical protein